MILGGDEPHQGVERKPRASGDDPEPVEEGGNLGE